MYNEDVQDKARNYEGAAFWYGRRVAYEEAINYLKQIIKETNNGA